MNGLHVSGAILLREKTETDSIPERRGSKWKRHSTNRNAKLHDAGTGRARSSSAPTADGMAGKSGGRELNHASPDWMPSALTLSYLRAPGSTLGRRAGAARQEHRHTGAQERGGE